MKKKYLLAVILSLGLNLAGQAAIIDFSDLTLGSESYNNSSDPGFVSGGAGFNNTYTYYGPDFESWGGFSYTNKTDTTPEADLWKSQYTAITGTDGNGVAGGTYGVAYLDSYTPTYPAITLPSGSDTPTSILVTNTVYTYYAMLDGYGTAKKFGGLDGTEEDWFLLTIRAYDILGTEISFVDFYLADYRFSDPAQDYIIDEWATIDLTSLGSGVAYLEFDFSSSDNGAWGMNTPAYVAIDNLVVVPEPSTWLLLVLGSILLVWKRRYAPRAA
jgi:hypothetical protein